MKFIFILNICFDVSKYWLWGFKFGVLNQNQNDLFVLVVRICN